MKVHPAGLFTDSAERTVPCLPLRQTGRPLNLNMIDLFLEYLSARNLITLIDWFPDSGNRCC